ncbi:MAG: hypothetical protein FWE67_12720 [Planctomycetaceae bacterium]|nr:hypothetical protein [Planctomycetaceae bacterium]
MNTDGWAAAMSAWSALFCSIVLIRCFLHAWLSIRDRAKHLKEMYKEVGKRVWAVYRAENVVVMKEKISELRRWAKDNVSGVVLEKVNKLCSRCRDWSTIYENEGCARTSNGLDRMMRCMDDYFEQGQSFHGSEESAKLRCRSWGLLYNYWDWCPKSVQDNDGVRCPAERLNKKRYDDDWLKNLLIATSMQKQNLQQKTLPQKMG